MERQPIIDKVFGALVRQRVGGLDHQQFEHHHRIEGRASAFAAVRIAECPVQLRPEQLEVDRAAECLQLIAEIAQPLQTIINIEQACLTRHRCPLPEPEESESEKRRFGKVNRTFHVYDSLINSDDDIDTASLHALATAADSKPQQFAGAQLRPFRMVRGGRSNTLSMARETEMSKSVYSGAVAAMAYLMLGAPGPARAAMLTNGGNFPYGGQICAESGGLLFTPGTAIALNDCHGYTNQQWNLELGQIFSYGLNSASNTCMDVLNGAVAPGSPVVLNQCSSATSQHWTIGGGPARGQIVNLKSKLCLDGTAQLVGTQLIINTCASSGLSQQWEIK